MAVIDDPSGQQLDIAQVPVPPRWAAHSAVEDGGVTHEVAVPLGPAVQSWAAHGWTLPPTDVLMATRDLLVGGRWVRDTPTLHVEGGTYSLSGARHLRDALDALLRAAGENDDGEPIPGRSAPQTA